jgi:SET domain-containing protein
MKSRKRAKLPHEGVCARLGASPINGVGVFAIKKIPKGTVIFPEDQEDLVWINKSSLRGLSPEEKRLYDDFCIILGNRYGCPKSFNELTPAWYFNESAAPNVGTDNLYRFYALRDIRKGEELTVDYDAYSDRPNRSG